MYRYSMAVTNRRTLGLGPLAIPFTAQIHAARHFHCNHLSYKTRRSHSTS